MLLLAGSSPYVWGRTWISLCSMGLSTGIVVLDEGILMMIGFRCLGMCLGLFSLCGGSLKRRRGNMGSYFALTLSSLGG